WRYLGTMIDFIFSADTIEAEYRRLGHTTGWRFMLCPEARLDDAVVALSTTNPAGDLDDPNVTERMRWSVEASSPHVIEQWPPGPARMQQQVRLMFQTV